MLSTPSLASGACWTMPRVCCLPHYRVPLLAFIFNPLLAVVVWCGVLWWCGGSPPYPCCPAQNAKCVGLFPIPLPLPGFFGESLTSFASCVPPEACPGVDAAAVSSLYRQHLDSVSSATSSGDSGPPTGFSLLIQSYLTTPTSPGASNSTVSR